MVLFPLASINPSRPPYHSLEPSTQPPPCIHTTTGLPPLFCPLDLTLFDAFDRASLGASASRKRQSSVPCGRPMLSKGSSSPPAPHAGAPCRQFVTGIVAPSMT